MKKSICFPFLLLSLSWSINETSGNALQQRDEFDEASGPSAPIAVYQEDPYDTKLTDEDNSFFNRFLNYWMGEDENAEELSLRGSQRNLWGWGGVWSGGNPSRPVVYCPPSSRGFFTSCSHLPQYTTGNTGIPPHPTTTRAPVTESNVAPPLSDIVDTAIAAGSFTVLTDLLTRAGLVDTLKDPNSLFTVFAPTDTAFPTGAALTAIETSPNLANILKYHVVSGKLLSSQLSNGMELQTLQGGNITISVSPTLTVTGGTPGNVANIIVTDIEASNGVIHAIDNVLSPP